MVLEKEIERKLTLMVKRNGGLCLKWVCPGWIGVPDRILLFPGGRVIFVETKCPKGSKVSKMQEWWRDKLQSLDFPVMYIYNLGQVAHLELYIQEEIAKERRQP